MKLRFVPPTPNCGHACSTFTWVGLAEIWMCAACIASIGPLYPRTCSKCGHPPPAGTQLIDVFRVGRLCFLCRRDHLATRRISN